MMCTLMLMIALGVNAARPQSGTYTIQNVATSKFVKVTGKYAAAPSASESEASKISFTVVGLDSKHNDGSYKIMGLSSTYTDGGKQVVVNVDDHIKHALTIGEVVLRKELPNSSEENIKKAIKAMTDFVNEYAYMRIKPVVGQTDTYYAIASTPGTDAIPADVLSWFYQKVTDSEYQGHPELGAAGFLAWGKKKVLEYLSEHSGEGGTNAGLAGYITRNLDKVDFNKTYILGGDNDNTFGYTIVEAGAAIPTDAKWQWKLNKDEAPQSATYKIHNVGQDKWVRIVGPYYAKPDATEADASEIGVTMGGQNADGSYKVTNLSGEYDGKLIDIQSYIDKAILLGKAAVADKLPNSSPENVAKAQQYMEDFVRTNAFMCLKPVPSLLDTYLAYATIPEIPAEVKDEWQAKYPNESDMFGWCKQIVKDYLGQHSGAGGTNSTLVSYVMNNIDAAEEGATYYLSAESNGTFGYAKAPANEDDQNLWWGMGEQTKPESGVYKIVNKQTLKYIKVDGKYHAAPTEADETTASEISFQLIGEDKNYNDGSYEIRHLSSTFVDANGKEQTVDIEDYIDKAIMIGNTVLEAEIGPNGNHPSSPENFQKAKETMSKFIKDWGYMRIKPVDGEENTYYAIATVPHIPDSIVTEFNKKITDAQYQGEEGMLRWGIAKVKAYLGENNTDSGLKAYILNNIDNLKIGRTYILRADDDNTFGYDYYDAATMPADKASILRNQWMLDQTDVIDEMGEVRTIKVRNVGKADVSEDNAYVKIIGRYYAKPNYSEDEATPIQVTIAQQNADGTYKVSDLAGDYNGNYISVQKYVEHAIELGKAAIAQVLKGVSSDENILRAQQRMEEFVLASAFMTLKAVPGENDTYYAIGTIPVIDDDIKAEFNKKYPGEDMFEWCKNYVLGYLENHNGEGGTDATLATVIKANLANAKEGHTYYLTAHPTDGTFDYVDATEQGVVTVEQNRYSWWGMADALIGDPAQGYFRIINAETNNCVNVTGPFAAQPNVTVEAAASMPGTIIYVGMDEDPTGNAYRVNTLRSQGVNANAYFSAITTVIDAVAKTGAELLEEKVAQTSYAQYASLVGPLVETLKSTIDVNAYAEPIMTTDGKQAFMLKATVPDLAYYCDLAMTGLSVMGMSKDELVTKLENRANASTSQAGQLVYGMAAKIARYLDDPDTMWSKMVEKLTDEDSEYAGLIAQLGLPEEMVAKGLNTLKKINYGTTYCIYAEPDKSFGLMARDEAMNNDLAKWVLQPVDEQNPLLLTTQGHGDYTPQVNDKGKVELVAYTDDNGGTSYYSAIFVDFDMQAAGVKAYTVTGGHKYGDGTVATELPTQNTYYIANCTLQEWESIPAQTPVLLRASQANAAIIPVGTPDPETAIESKVLADKILGVEDAINNVLGRNGAPRRVQVDGTNGNLLVGSFFGDVTDGSQYYALKEAEASYDQPIADSQMNGLGFWVPEESDMGKPNTAYLKVTNLIGQDPFEEITIDTTDPELAVGYILQLSDEPVVVTEVSTVKTNAQVASVKYINVAGMVSDRPFEGINLIETTYTDGTKTVTKVMK